MRNAAHGWWPFYGASITSSELIMPDGHSLEKVGVIPDVLALPAAADLAAGRDTVLAQAVRLAGGSADPAVVVKAFPTIWVPSSDNEADVRLATARCGA